MLWGSVLVPQGREGEEEGAGRSTDPESTDPTTPSLKKDRVGTDGVQIVWVQKKGSIPDRRGP